MALELRVEVLEGRPLRRVGLGGAGLLDRGGEGCALALCDRPRRRQRPEIGPGLVLKPSGLRAGPGVPEIRDEAVELPVRLCADAELRLVRFVRQPLKGAPRTNRVELLLRHLREVVAAKLVAHIGEELLRLLGERPRGLPEGVREDVAVFPIQKAQVAERGLVAVKLMCRRALVHVLVVGARDLSPEGVLPSGDHLLRVHFLLLGGLVRLLDERDLDLGLLGVELRLKPTGQLHGLLNAVRVVVLHRAPVDLERPRVELRVDDAVLAEGRALPFPKLPVVELDDEVAVDLLHLSHTAAPSCCSVPCHHQTEGGLSPSMTPRGAFRL